MEQSQFERCNQKRLEFIGQTKVDENNQYKITCRVVDKSDPNYGYTLVYKCHLMSHVLNLIEVVEPSKQLDLEL
jgi:hypothetical protein